jgi:aspartate 4-decarboxylase
MSTKLTKKIYSRAAQRKLQTLSPFELKDTLISLAKENSKNSTAAMLNAGRGNPNWIATDAREAFFTLGEFALQESKLTWDVPGLGGMPKKEGIAERFTKYLDKATKKPGAGFLRDAIEFGTDHFNFEEDAFVHELVDSIIGDNYPVPDRMLKHNEAIVHAYLEQEMCDNKPPKGHYDLFAVEGGTAAMCYIFDSLMVNKLLKKGDTIALATPTFTPYLEIAELERFSFKVVHVEADEMTPDGTRHTWQYSEEQLNKLLNPKVKAFFVVNPSNPPSVEMSDKGIKTINKIVKTKRPDLIIITDDVYGTFVNNFKSLMAMLPQNTIGVYSFSKFFGCTGWRLGVIAIHENNIFDKRIAKLPLAARKELNHRYSSITLEPEKLKLIDRMVADSRFVALNHTAGLSLPQQVMMSLFSLQSLMDKENHYKTLTQNIVQRRLKALFEGMGISLPENQYRTGYYTELDLMVWAEVTFGKDFADYLQKNYEPTDVLFRLAQLSSTVLMFGGGFAGPSWSVRVSLANLDEEEYPKIGEHLKQAAESYYEEFQAHQNGKH